MRAADPQHARDPGAHGVADTGGADATARHDPRVRDEPPGEQGPMSYWEQLERPAPDAVIVDGVELRRRSRVRLRPAAPAPTCSTSRWTGKTAVVEEVVEDMEGDGAAGGHGRGRSGPRPRRGPPDRPPLLLRAGRGRAARPAKSREAARLRILVAGIGNVFLGDDGFGVEVAGRLARSELPAGSWSSRTSASAAWTSPTRWPDYDVAIFVDAMPRGGAPGTLYSDRAGARRRGGGSRRPRHGPGHGARTRARAGRTRCRGCWWSAASRRRC